MPFNESSQAAPQPNVLCWENGAILVGDVRTALREIPEKSVHCVVTSPPYFGLRSYGIGTEGGEIGQEKTLQAYLDEMVSVFRELRRVLRDDGVFWLNIGDSYAANRTYQVRDNKHTDVGNTGGMKVPDGMKPKDLMMVPARLAIALQADGWYLRSQMPWAKRNVMPESVKDRPTSAIEYVYMFTKSTDYFYDHVAVQQPATMKPQNRYTNGRGPKSEGYAPHRQPTGMTSCATRNFRNTDLFFTSLEKPHNLITDLDGEPLALDVNPYPFKGAHFATFPVKLVEPLITAATSEKGCCPRCSAQIERISEKVPAKGRSAGNGFKREERLSYGERGDETVWTPKADKTTGWRFTCTCFPPSEPVPCTVLDPFAGACTTLMVADRMGRNSLGVELNPDYAQMGLKRIQDDRSKRLKL